MHTPGKWEVDLETGEITSTLDGSTVVIGTIYGADDFPCCEEDIAEECRDNARLIAAAPELFGALQSFVDYYDQAGMPEILTDDDEINGVDGFSGDEVFNMRRARAALR